LGERAYLTLITLPGVSPDFSIFESLAFPIKKKFDARRYATEKAGLAHIKQISDEELDQK
jgi:hypothetical protein